MAGLVNILRTLFAGTRGDGEHSEEVLVCPKCGDEYRSGFSQCGNCLVELVHPSSLVSRSPGRPIDKAGSGQPPALDRTAELVAVSQGALAEMKRQQHLLAQSGIASLPVRIGPPGTGGGCCSTPPVVLQVDVKNRDAALTLLQDDFRRMTGLSDEAVFSPAPSDDDASHCVGCTAPLAPNSVECPACGLRYQDR